MHKVLVANRGAIARRVIDACRQLGIASVAVYADPDADAPYLAEAGEAFSLSGTTAADTYLNQARILQIARQCGADAVHPGYGFLAENSEFAQAVIDQGLTFIGPAPQWLARMGDKVSARALMAQQGLPVFPGSDLVTDDATAEQIAQQIGYPVLIKPSGGGGGMGMVRVDEPAALAVGLQRARAVAQGAFDNAGVFIEKLIQRPRHIEFQVLGGHGRVCHAFERECSVQRRNQKLIEESPAPGLDAAKVEALADQVARVCEQLGYTNIGTVETLFDADGEVGFLEMNTRIQVEHAVTEMVTGLDLVALQIQLAAGGQLPQRIERAGHAIEARIYAEDPRSLLPSTGRLTVFEVPHMHAVRVETGYARGVTVTPHFDAMLAKVIAYGHTRELAIGRLSVALRAFTIRGVKTNQPLLLQVLADSSFLQGQLDTGIIDRIIGSNT